MRSFTKCCSAVLLLTTVWIAGCQDAQTPVQPEPDVTMQAAKTPPGPTVIAALDEAIQGEYYLQAMYARALTDLGEDVKPFSRVARAEDRHIAALAKRYTKYQMDVPASNWSVDDFEVFDTRLDACAAAILAETQNGAMYTTLLATELPAKVVSAFTTLQEASLDSHLPAFTRCK
ncbi:MAG: DUF2202 domain-containing protein [Gemmatimonadota bacterium]|jgi:hypothetical protein